MKNNPPGPPRVALSLLLSFMDLEERESVAAAVEGIYSGLTEGKGRRRARAWFWGQFVRSLPRLLNKRLGGHLAMFFSNLKTALRHFSRRKAYSLINTTGLAVGLVCFLLIALYVRYEYSYDRFHTDSDDIYRVVHEGEHIFKKSNLFALTSAPLAPIMLAEYPEIEHATRIDGIRRCFLKTGENGIYQQGIFADEEFFDVFSFELMRGDLEDALSKPFSMVLSEGLARKLFGGTDPIGRVLNIDDTYDVTVTGIHRDVPGNSHIRFDFILSFLTIGVIPGRDRDLNHWPNYSYYTYVKLRPGTPPEGFGEKLHALITKHVDAETADEMRYFLQPLRSIHLSPQFRFGIGGAVDKRTILLFSLIAFFILLIACINYMNLATARCVRRSREVGVRKVVGARRFQLIRQLTGESMLLVGFALALAMVIIRIVLPAYSRFIGRDLSMSLLHRPSFLLFLLGTLAAVGLLSGSYPAFFISSFRPVKALKGAMGQSRALTGVRSALVVLQFTLSIILISCTGIVDHQMRYIRNKDVGFDREHVVVIPARNNDTGLRQNAESFKQDVLRHPRILKVSACGVTPLATNGGGTARSRGDGGEEIEFDCWKSYVDYDFLDIFDIELLMGRYFSPEFSTDAKKAVVINQAALEALGWRDPIGKTLSLHEFEQATIIGVVKDYNFWSLHQKIEPMVLALTPGRIDAISLRISPRDISGTLAFIEDTYNRFRSSRPFAFTFLDETFDRLYRSDLRFGSIFTLFSLISVFIACLGLFGLAAFTAEQKTKEIGIRKVLGASTTGITLLLSRQYTRWVVLANLIAWPAAYLGMTLWLKSFHYRAGIGLWLFPASGALALGIALLTVGFQSIRAARSNPADTLKYE